MFLIINLGLKSIRGIVFNLEGDILFSKSLPVNSSIFMDKVEQDVDEWSQHLHLILKDLSNKPQISREILYISATTSSSCLIGVDKKINPITKMIMVSDKRAQAESSYINDLPFYNKKTDDRLFCQASSMIPKILWFKNNKKTLFRKVYKWIGANELINHFFTDEIVSDPLNASKTFFDGKRYNNELIAELGLSVDSLPNVVPIGTAYSVSPKLIKKYNFSPRANYVITTYDAICAVVGSDVGIRNNACEVSGTVTSVRILSDSKIMTKNPLLVSQKIDLLNKYVFGLSNNLGGGIIEWYKQTFFKNEGKNIYSKLEKLASNSSPGAGSLIFLPYLLGERAPFNLPKATGTFFGINRSTKINDITRAVFESTAFVTRNLLIEIQNSGVNVDSLSLSGGLARIDFINKVKADVINLPVHIVSNFESTAIGSLILTSIASGTHSNLEEAQKSFIKIRKTIFPSNKRVKIYDEVYSLFKELNNGLIDFYEKREKLDRNNDLKNAEYFENL